MKDGEVEVVGEGEGMKGVRVGVMVCVLEGEEELVGEGVIEVVVEKDGETVGEGLIEGDGVGTQASPIPSRLESS